LLDVIKIARQLLQRDALEPHFNGRLAEQLTWGGEGRRHDLMLSLCPSYWPGPRETKNCEIWATLSQASTNVFHKALLGYMFPGEFHLVELALLIGHQSIQRVQPLALATGPGDESSRATATLQR
jgi:hypothetical protein